MLAINFFIDVIQNCKWSTKYICMVRQLIDLTDLTIDLEGHVKMTIVEEIDSMQLNIYHGYDW